MCGFSINIYKEWFLKLHLKYNQTINLMESIQQKQLYLRKNIIDAGFDAQQFAEYCTNQHDLVDLEDWPLQKLKNVVCLYAQIKNSNNQNHQPMNEDFDQWGHFQTQSNENKTSQIKNTNHHGHSDNHGNQNQQINTTKTGHLIFSQADWDMFMGVGPNNNSSNIHKPNIIPSNNQQTINYPTLNKSSLEANKKSQQINLQVLSKNQSLNESKSPALRSNQKKEVTQEANKSQIQGKDNPLSPPSQQIKKNQYEEKSPINLVNVKLMTIKAKAMPKLPQINDIHITKTQQISRNFLQSDYTLYYIHFNPGNHFIQRKFSDLRKFRSILQKIYPHIRLPYLQPEGWINSSQGKDSQTLAKYKWMVIDFIKYIIIRNDQLKNSQIVRKFCGYSTNIKSNVQVQLLSKQQLKKMLQGYESFPQPKYIGQLCLNQNKIVIPPTKNGQKLVNNTNSLLIQVDAQYQRLKKQLQNLFYNYELISKSFVQISSTYQNLQNLIKKYNYDNNESKQLRVYDGLREMTNKMRNTINQQYIIFKSRLRNVFRFQKDNMTTLKQLFESKNKIHNQYVRQGYPMLSSTNKSSTGELEVDSNISLEEPSRNNKNTLCVQEIFWSNAVKEEIRCYWEELRKKINEQLTLIAYDELDNQNDNLNFWNSVIKKCVV